MFDTGSQIFGIPKVYFKEIKDAGDVDNPALYEHPGSIINCSEIYKYLPEIEIDFRDKYSGTTTIIRVSPGKLYEKYLNPYVDMDQCLIQIQ